MPKPTLSVILITQNEARDIRDCLESVRWADEMIVVDSGSTDETLAICRRYTGKIFTPPGWPGFGPQKNRALAQASGDWVLSIDADERVTPALRREIEAVLATDHAAVAYRLPRRSTYCGKVITHLRAWRRDAPVRLFKRGAGRFSDDPVHEKVLVDGKVGRLSAPLLHLSFHDLEEVLDKINRYSTAVAAQRQRAGRRAGLSTAILRGLWTFIQNYFFGLGFLDGREGFMLSVSNAEGCYYRYLKLMRLNAKDDAAR